MEFSHINIRSNSFLLLVTAFFILLVWSCGGSSSSNDTAAGTGKLSFKIAYNGAARDVQLEAASIDCTGQGIATVEAKI